MNDGLAFLVPSIAINITLLGRVDDFLKMTLEDCVHADPVFPDPCSVLRHRMWRQERVSKPTSPNLQSAAALCCYLRSW
jgi:hypothetical protein